VSQSSGDIETADVLSQVAQVFRLKGSLSGVLRVAPPWGYEMPESHHVVLLVVTRGRIFFEPATGSGPSLELASGDVLALPQGQAHTLRDAPGTPVRPFREAAGLAQQAGEASRPAQTEFIALCCELTGGCSNPVRSALPTLLHFPGTDGRVARFLEPTVRLLAVESGGTAPGRTIVLNRLAEVIFIQMIRAWLEGLEEGEGGWLHALTDPHLAPAIAAIHDEPGAPWTVALLAKRADMSRSAFASRFRAMVGETPLGYLTRWRMQQAAAMIESGAAPLKEIIASLGYSSEAAFRTVFRRWSGQTPGRYRASAHI